LIHERSFGWAAAKSPGEFTSNHLSNQPRPTETDAFAKEIWRKILLTVWQIENTRRFESRRVKPLENKWG